MRSLLRLGVLGAVLLSIVGCAEQTSSASKAIENRSRELTPSDSKIAAIYDRSCRSCHTVAATSAPLTGDTVAWSDRFDKGLNTLVDNVVNGFGGMPPFGMCMDCNIEEFEALILFMAQRTGSGDDQHD